MIVITSLPSSPVVYLQSNPHLPPYGYPLAPTTLTVSLSLPQNFPPLGRWEVDEHGGDMRGA